jgi:hypothetical protein
MQLACSQDDNDAIAGGAQIRPCTRSQRHTVTAANAQPTGGPSGPATDAEQPHHQHQQPEQHRHTPPTDSTTHNTSATHETNATRLNPTCRSHNSTLSPKTHQRPIYVATWRRVTAEIRHNAICRVEVVGVVAAKQLPVNCEHCISCQGLRWHSGGSQGNGTCASPSLRPCMHMVGGK